MKMQIRFDGPPGPVPGRFIEVEDEHGASIKVGEWKEDGANWLLVINTDTSHAYCHNCDAIQPVFVEELHSVSTPKDTDSWLAGDMVCKVCAFIVATLYAPDRSHVCHFCARETLEMHCPKCGEEMVCTLCGSCGTDSCGYVMEREEMEAKQ